MKSSNNKHQIWEGSGLRYDSRFFSEKFSEATFVLFREAKRCQGIILLYWMGNPPAHGWLGLSTVKQGTGDYVCVSERVGGVEELN